MVPAQHDRFVNLHETKALLHPDQPGHVIASLAVKAPNSFSGKFFSWDEDALIAHRRP